MDKTDLQKWEDCLRIIKDNLTPEQFNTWFRPITLKNYENGRLTLSVPTYFFVESIEERFATLLGGAIRRVFGQSTQLFYHYEQVSNDPSTGTTVRNVPTSVANKKGQPEANPFHTPVESSFDSQLNPRYSFENYFGSECNRLALSIGRQIGKDPENKTFNPLFIFGPSGVGKTHLMHAIGLSIKENRPDMRVLYISSRLFEAQFTAAMRNGRINEFIYFYQSIDALIIDDVQDLIDKVKTQNTFFQIFNHLHLNNKQIILSSDCCPSQLKGMPERLISRMKWGITVELERPDAKLRHDVLVCKAEQNGLEISPEILDFIAENATENIRELEGVVASLLVRATVLGCDINLDMARSVLSHSVKISKRQINFEMVIQSVSQYYNIEPDAIFTKSRKREISDARQMVMYMAKKHAKMALTAIGTRLSRTHATVLYACKNIDERLPYEKQLQDDIAAIEKSFIA